MNITIRHLLIGSVLFIACAGVGPYYPEKPNDAVGTDTTYENSTEPTSFAATPPGGPGTQFTVGIYTDPSATYEYISDFYGKHGRTYGIGVEFQPTRDHDHHREPKPVHSHHHEREAGSERGQNQS